MLMRRCFAIVAVLATVTLARPTALPSFHRPPPSAREKVAVELAARLPLRVLFFTKTEPPSSEAMPPPLAMAVEPLVAAAEFPLMVLPSTIRVAL